MILIYQPNHPNADENGMIERGVDAPGLGLYVIRDEMEPTRHMADGNHYTSKAKFRAATKAAGCYEIGNEPVRQRKPVPLNREKRREDIKRTIYNIRNGIRTE